MWRSSCFSYHKRLRFNLSICSWHLFPSFLYLSYLWMSCMEFFFPSSSSELSGTSPFSVNLYPCSSIVETCRIVDIACEEASEVKSCFSSQVPYFNDSKIDLLKFWSEAFILFCLLVSLLPYRLEYLFEQLQSYRYCTILLNSRLRAMHCCPIHRRENVIANVLITNKICSFYKTLCPPIWSKLLSMG